MLKQSRRSFLATARWILAIWATVIVSSMILPCGKAFALPGQGEQTASNAMPGAKQSAYGHAYTADAGQSLPSDSSYCDEIPGSIPLKANATPTPMGAGFSAAIANHKSLLLESAPVARIYTRTPAAPPRVLLKTSRLLI